MTKATKTDLEGLHALMTQKMRAILSGETPPTAAELNTIRQFLKDNNVTVVPGTERDLDDLRNKTLPFPDVGDEAAAQGLMN
jgi:hypothetical protein